MSHEQAPRLEKSEVRFAARSEVPTLVRESADMLGLKLPARAVETHALVHLDDGDDEDDKVQSTPKGVLWRVAQILLSYAVGIGVGIAFSVPGAALPPFAIIIMTACIVWGTYRIFR